MSFFRTRNSITFLERKDRLSTNDLLEMMIGVVDDVYEYNATETGVDNLSVEDHKKLLLSTLRLLNTLNTVCESNWDNLGEMTSIIQKRLNNAKAKAESNRQELSRILAETETAEQELSSLEENRASLEHARGHLLSIREQCDEVRAKIDALNDPVLDEIASEKEQLEAELAERENTFASYQNEVNDLRARLAEQETLLAQCRREADETARKLHQCTTDCQAAAQEKSRLEAEIESIKAQIDELNQWIQAFPEWSESLRVELSELQDKSTLLLNAWNSAWNNHFLSLALEELPPESKQKALLELAPPSGGFNTFNDIKEWYRSVCTCAASLSEQCVKKLQTLIHESQKILAPIKQEEK